MNLKQTTTQDEIDQYFRALVPAIKQYLEREYGQFSWEIECDISKWDVIYSGKGTIYVDGEKAVIRRDAMRDIISLLDASEIANEIGTEATKVLSSPYLPKLIQYQKEKEAMP